MIRSTGKIKYLLFFYGCASFNLLFLYLFCCYFPKKSSHNKLEMKCYVISRRQLSESYQMVISWSLDSSTARQSSGVHQKFTRQSPGSQQAVTWQSPGSHQTVTRQSPGSHQEVTKTVIRQSDNYQTVIDHSSDSHQAADHQTINRQSSHGYFFIKFAQPFILEGLTVLSFVLKTKGCTILR